MKELHEVKLQLFFFGNNLCTYFVTAQQQKFFFTWGVLRSVYLSDGEFNGAAAPHYRNINSPEFIITSQRLPFPTGITM